MDDLTPPLLTAIREIRWHLLSGHSIKESVGAYFNQHSDELAVRLHELWALKLQGHAGPGRALSSHRAQALWELIERAHLGQPILEPLGALEDDVEAAVAADLDLHVATLPFKALVPLLMFQFPAFALLLIGPLLRDLARYSLALALAFAVAGAQARAEALSTAALRKMAGAKTAGDIEKIRNAFDDLRILRMACDLQLKERSIPTACYQALELEQKWGLSSKSHAARIRVRIDRRCADAARRFQGLASPLSKDVSTKCRTSVARAKELKEYQQSDQHEWRGS
jgi:hypothetical protein